MKNYIIKIAKFYFPLAFVMTLVMALVYVAVQHNFRVSANDPQIQLAEDFASQLSAGRTVESINTSNSVDIAKSLSLFIFIYDDAGNIVAGTGKLNGNNPILPAGVLDHAKKVGESRITWQPQSGLRFALVITRYEGARSGLVVVGRSLREVEQRVSTLGWQVLSAWLIGLVGLLGLMFGTEILLSRRSAQ